MCKGESCRSQIAEGYLKYFARDKAKVDSTSVNPWNIQTLKQDGIDISQYSSNHID